MDIGLCTGFGISPLQRKVLDKNPERWLCYVLKHIDSTPEEISIILFFLSSGKMRNNKNEFNLWGDWNVCTFELLWLFFGKEVVFSKTYPSFLTLKEGSTSHLGLLPSGKKRETALLGDQNRYALRLADHQRSSPWLCGMGPPGESLLR